MFKVVAISKPKYSVSYTQKVERLFDAILTRADDVLPSQCIPLGKDVAAIMLAELLDSPMMLLSTILPHELGHLLMSFLFQVKGSRIHYPEFEEAFSKALQDRDVKSIVHAIYDALFNVTSINVNGLMLVPVADDASFTRACSELDESIGRTFYPAFQKQLQRAIATNRVDKKVSVYLDKCRWTHSYELAKRGIIEVVGEPEHTAIKLLLFNCAGVVMENIVNTVSFLVTENPFIYYVSLKNIVRSALHLLCAHSTSHYKGDFSVSSDELRNSIGWGLTGVLFFALALKARSVDFNGHLQRAINNHILQKGRRLSSEAVYEWTCLLVEHSLSDLTYSKAFRDRTLTILEQVSPKKRRAKVSKSVDFFLLHNIDHLKEHQKKIRHAYRSKDIALLLKTMNDIFKMFEKAAKKDQATKVEKLKPKETRKINYTEDNIVNHYFMIQMIRSFIYILVIAFIVNYRDDIFF